MWPQVCQAFRSRAQEVANGARAAGLTVTINELPAEGRKPDRGSFVIVAGGKTVVELKGQERPFPGLKALNIADVTKQTIAAAQA